MTKTRAKPDANKQIVQQLEAMAKKLLETARKLPPGPTRHDFLKEIGRFRAQISALRQSQTEKAG
jgi:hypothetical protein